MNSFAYAEISASSLMRVMAPLVKFDGNFTVTSPLLSSSLITAALLVVAKLKEGKFEKFMGFMTSEEGINERRKLQI